MESGLAIDILAIYARQLARATIGSMEEERSCREKEKEGKNGTYVTGTNSLPRIPPVNSVDGGGSSRLTLKLNFEELSFFAGHRAGDNSIESPFHAAYISRVNDAHRYAREGIFIRMERVKHRRLPNFTAPIYTMKANKRN